MLLTRDSILDVLEEVTVVPITSTIRDIPSEVLLTEEDGMATTCAINCDHLQTVPQNRLGALITTLPPHRMQEVRGALLLHWDSEFALLRGRPSRGLGPRLRSGGAVSSQPTASRG